MKIWLLLLLMVSAYCHGFIETQEACPTVKSALNENFNPEKFAGTWYEQIHTKRWEDPINSCIAYKLQLVNDTFFRLETYATLPRAFDTVVFQKGHAVILGSNNNNNAKALLNVTLSGTTHPVLVVDTDYKSFAILWSCIESGNKSYQKVITLTRQQFPDFLVLITCMDLLEKYNITRAELVYTEQRGCPKLLISGNSTSNNTPNLPSPSATTKSSSNVNTDVSSLTATATIIVSTSAPSDGNLFIEASQPGGIGSGPDSLDDNDEDGDSDTSNRPPTTPIDGIFAVNQSSPATLSSSAGLNPTASPVMTISSQVSSVTVVSSVGLNNTTATGPTIADNITTRWYPYASSTFSSANSTSTPGAPSTTTSKAANSTSMPPSTSTAKPSTTAKPSSSTRNVSCFVYSLSLSFLLILYSMRWKFCLIWT